MVLHRIMSRRRFLVGSAAAGALALVPSLRSVPAAGATSTGVYTVNSGGLRLRSGPGTGYRTLATLSLGTQVTYLGYAGWANGHEWAHVELRSSSGLRGYVAHQYISSSLPGGGWAIGSMVHVDSSTGRANLRASASISAAVIAVIWNGQTGTIQAGPSQANGYTWYKVHFGDVTGWMATVVLAPGGGSDRANIRVASGPLNVRRQPGLGGAVLGTVSTGATGFVTTEMPQTADGYTWINVQFSSGLRGWVASSFVTWT